MNRIDLQNMTILEVGHVTEGYGPVEALRDYLVPRCEHFYLIMHPLPETMIENLRLEHNGEKLRSTKRIRHQIPEHIKEFFATLVWALNAKGRIDLFIGVTSFDAFPGLLLKRAGKVRRVVFYSADYSEKRFSSNVLNRVYRAIDSFSTRHADYVFTNTERSYEARAAQGLRKGRGFIARNGVFLNRIPPLNLAQEAHKKLYFVGHLSKTHGVQDIIEVMVEIVSADSNIKLSILGSGPYEDELRRTVTAKGLEQNIEFLGRLDNHEVLVILSTGGIGLAPYSTEESWVRYCDPVKVKEYLACGCPVIISCVPEIGQEIAANGAGLQYSTREELKAAILNLTMSKEMFKKCRNSAIELGQKYDWDRIYDAVFEKIG